MNFKKDLKYCIQDIPPHLIFDPSEMFHNSLPLTNQTISLSGISPNAEKYIPGKIIPIPYSEFVSYLKTRSKMSIPKINTYISTILPDGIIPVIDADTDTHLNVTKRLKTGYAVLQSSAKYKIGPESPNVYTKPVYNTRWWIFIEPTKTFEEAYYITASLGDTYYQYCCNYQKEYVIRAYPKQAFIPKITYIDKKCSQVFRNWLSAFEAYWKTPHIRSIVTDQLIRMM